MWLMLVVMSSNVVGVFSRLLALKSVLCEISGVWPSVLEDEAGRIVSLPDEKPLSEDEAELPA